MATWDYILLIGVSLPTVRVVRVVFLRNNFFIYFTVLKSETDLEINGSFSGSSPYIFTNCVYFPPYGCTGIMKRQRIESLRKFHRGNAEASF